LRDTAFDAIGGQEESHLSGLPSFRARAAVAGNVLMVASDYERKVYKFDESGRILSEISLSPERTQADVPGGGEPSSEDRDGGHEVVTTGAVESANVLIYSQYSADDDITRITLLAGDRPGSTADLPFQLCLLRSVLDNDVIALRIVNDIEVVKYALSR